MRKLCGLLICALGCGLAMASRTKDTPERKAAETAGRDLLDELASSPHAILHESYRDGNWEIFSRRADGSEPRNLTRTPRRHEMYPQASPDGGRIAFVADEELDGKKVRSVYFMERDGSGTTLVARHARQPCWSPDGNVIAYLPGEFERFTVQDFATKGLVFHDVTTGKQRAHPNPALHHLYNPTWSADGRWIIATVHGGMGYGHAILAIEAGGKGVFDLKIPGCRPDLSPDGRRIAWGKDDHTIAVADIDLSGERPTLTNHRELVQDAQHLYHADWSPDGRYITFSRGPGGRVSPDGPGTNRGLAEFVGVRAQWDLCVIRSSGEGGWAALTSDGQSNKESEWLHSASAGEATN